MDGKRGSSAAEARLQNCPLLSAELPQRATPNSFSLIGDSCLCSSINARISQVTDTHSQPSHPQHNQQREYERGSGKSVGGGERERGERRADAREARCLCWDCTKRKQAHCGDCRTEGAHTMLVRVVALQESAGCIKHAAMRLPRRLRSQHTAASRGLLSSATAGSADLLAWDAVPHPLLSRCSVVRVA